LVGQRWMFVQLDACPWRTSNLVSNVVWFVIAGAHSPIDLNGDAVRRSRLTAQACSRTVECGDRRGARRASSSMDGRKVEQLQPSQMILHSNSGKSAANRTV